MARRAKGRDSTSSPTPKQKKRGRTRSNGSTESRGKAPGRVGDQMHLLSALALVIGTMIGAGIFAFIGNLRTASGSAALSILVWLSTGLYILLVSVCYIELNSVCEGSGAEYSFLMKAFGPTDRFLGQLPAFFYYWTSLLVLRPISLAIQLQIYSAYVLKPVINNCDSCSRLNVSIMTAFVLIILVAMNCWSVTQEIEAQLITAAIKLVTCFVIIGVSTWAIEKKKDDLLTIDEQVSWSSLMMACYYTLWAYDGWNSLSYCSKSLWSPTQSQLVSSLLGIPSVMIIYILLTSALLTTVPLPIIISSPTTFLSWAEHNNPYLYFPIAVGVSISVLGTVNGLFFTYRRLCEAGTKGGHAPAILTTRLTPTGAPPMALALIAVIAEVLVIVADTNILVKCFGVITGVFQGQALVALLVLRKTEPNKVRPFRLPLIIPQMMLLPMTVFTVLSILSFDPGILSSAIVFFSILSSVYAVFVFARQRYFLFENEHI